MIGCKMIKFQNKTGAVTTDINTQKSSEDSDALKTMPKPFPAKDLNNLVGNKNTVSRPEIPRGGGKNPSVSIDNDNCLTVGRNICLSGEITACQKLVVNGQVEATLNEAHTIEVLPGGCFKGDAEVVDAIIGGGFIGKITVSNVLTIKKMGVVKGSVRYGKIIIEEGGQILGEMAALKNDDNDNSSN